MKSEINSELAMAVNSKFNSILDEVQQSKLNFCINLTPYAAYITFKKSAQVDPYGNQAVPTPPVLRLLELSLREKLDHELEISSLKGTLMKYEQQCDKLICENQSLSDEVSKIEESLVKSKVEADIANKKIELLENEVSKVQLEKKNLAKKLSIIDKENRELKCNFDRDVKAMNKSLKSKEKEIHNLNKKIDNLKDNNANMKYDLSEARTIQHSLTVDLKKMEQKIEKMKVTKSHTYCLSEQLPPIFGSHLCKYTKAIFLSKSLPDLSTITWVSRTDEDTLQELADQALDYLYDCEISNFYEEAKEKAKVVRSILGPDTG